MYTVSDFCSVIWKIPFRSGNNFLDVPWTISKFSTKTRCPIFSLLALLVLFCLAYPSLSYCSRFLLTTWCILIRLFSSKIFYLVCFLFCDILKLFIILAFVWECMYSSPGQFGNAQVESSFLSIPSCIVNGIIGFRPKTISYGGSPVLECCVVL